MKLLTETYHEQIHGTLSCFDRIIIQGTLPVFCHADGMTSYLNAKRIRIFDYPQFAMSLRDQLIQNTESIAKKHGIK